ncbi:MAG: hypothetical protein WCX48_00085 [Bacteroidales bacterium]
MKPIFAAFFGLFMVVFYLVFSGMLAFTDIFTAIIPKKIAYILAAILFLYGIFRGYRYYKLNKNR